jgi:hypothetical protein
MSVTAASPTDNMRFELVVVVIIAQSLVGSILIIVDP